MGTERETNRKNSAGMKCADLLAHVSNANKCKFLLSSSVTVSVRFLSPGTFFETNFYGSAQMLMAPFVH